jgi:hypothetical protein
MPMISCMFKGLTMNNDTILKETTPSALIYGETVIYCGIYCNLIN